ncbi:PilZ domain-containing protein [Fuerstiella marisgermanici]|uniref:PilZ domain protein n=1 Tax=Fuerstiella marisgermanici TaxID=1891926 RepID=A0A1P8WIH7_9PLAN|nr:PilZ domain-containing protein [Fuerstiella marisgermanici]APZ93861.1 PilZ domain protein [Fuerstiella marisgermanici]
MTFSPTKTIKLSGRMQRLAKAAHDVEVAASVAMTNLSQRSAIVIGVSSVDLRLIVDGKPEFGERITVQIPVPGNGREMSVEGIVHWAEMRGSEYEVGVFLLGGLPRELRHLQKDPRRQAERYRCWISGRMDWGNTQPDAEGVVINYSHEGMAVKSPTEAAIEELFTFRWNDGKCVRRVAGIALWQIEQNGGFLIGCKLNPRDGFQLAGLNAEHLS